MKSQEKKSILSVLNRVNGEQKKSIYMGIMCNILLLSFLRAFKIFILQ